MDKAYEAGTFEQSRDLVLSPTAVRVAHHLAAAHGHTWGNIDPADLPGLPTAADIDRRCREAAGNEPGPVGWGITSPSVDEAGVVFHTTGSGRFRWDVAPGRLSMWWSRPLPTGEYCGVDVTWDDGGPARVEVRAIDPPGYSGCGVIFARHVEYVLGDLSLGLAAVRVAGVEVATAEADWVGAVRHALDPVRVDEVGWHLAEAEAHAGRAAELVAAEGRQWESS